MSDLTNQYIIAQEEHDYNEKYEEGTIVKHTIDNVTTAYTAKKNVPKFVSILDKRYWKKIASTDEGGTVDYDNLKNKPSINGVELDGNKTSSDLGMATSQQGAKADTAYQKPTTGIPESDLSSDVQQALQKHFKGWWPDLATLKAAHTAIEGDSAYVKDASPATTWSIYVYDSTASSDNYWADSGTDADTSNMQTFATGEEVNEIYIDDTHLVNPKSGALPTADDALQLKAKLEKVSLSETAATYSEFIPEATPALTSGFYRRNGVWQESADTKSVSVDVTNIRFVRFLGIHIKNAANSSSPAYCFKKSDDSFCSGYPKAYDASVGSYGLREYIVSVPSDAAYFVCMSKYDVSTFPADNRLLETNFFIYTQTGSLALSDDDVENIPTIGSNKLVTSDGIAKRLNGMGLFSCASSPYTDSKIVNGDFVIRDGNSFHIKFTYKNMADTPTMNINSTGEKAMFYKGEPVTPTNSWKAGDTLIGYYDSTYDNNNGAYYLNPTYYDNSNNEDNFAKIDNNILDRNVGYTNRDFTRGTGYLIATGAVVENDNTVCSLKIEVPSGSLYINIIGYRDGGTKEGICFFDENGDFIEGANLTSMTQWRTMKIDPSYKQVAMSGIYTSSDYTIKILFTNAPIFSENVFDSFTAEEKEHVVESLGVENIIEGMVGPIVQDYIVPTNIFGDILPQAFKQKLYSNEDILIAVQGDSIVAKTDKCSLDSDAAHTCPGGTYDHWVKLLQFTVGKVKPYYNRLDSIRDNTDFFTKVGTFEQIGSDYFATLLEADGRTKYWYFYESSSSATTYMSKSNGASVTFEFDADTYEKCNIIYTRSIDAGNAAITIAEGNGKLLVSTDRSNWVEANGFSHSQAITGVSVGDGEACVQRHRRLWMKKASDSVTGTITVTYQKTTVDSTTAFYCWGTEMYFGRGIFFDNLGRGGKTIGVLGNNISDIFDRNPDLSIVECPLANDLGSSAYTTFALLQDGYAEYFTGNEGTSYKYRSENYTKFPLLVVLPHIRMAGFSGNAAVLESVSQQTIRTMPAYDIYKLIWGWLHTQLASYNNVCFVNMLDQILAVAKTAYGTIEAGLTGGNLTSDNIHCNDATSMTYNNYLSPVFQI